MSPRKRPADDAQGLPGTLSEQALMRIVTENAKVGLVLLGPDRRHLYANRTYVEIMGLPRWTRGRPCPAAVR
jgi:PAS domain-containing protein